MKSGKLELVIGNMFSGKSTELIRRLRCEQVIHKKCLVVNYFGDNRYNNTNSIATHDNLTTNAIKLQYLRDLPINDFDTLFIDEGQFFNDLFEVVKDLVDNHFKHVIVSGLDGDSNRNKFGSILDLIPLADEVHKLRAYCTICCDGTYGSFTKKIIKNNDIQIDIGGSDKYLPVCRYHYLL